ncbi:MAG: cyclopropane-fatty-acyl-phospholipid synthase family protein [Chloroflexota bacterium]|nr:cyclopropane-fatty-acyl-phospholipid synthase family protein [Chloroflexota bacterium]
MVTVEKEAPVTSPASPHAGDTSNARQITLDILNRLFGATPPRTAAIHLWDGTRWPENAPENVAATVILNHPGALRRMFLPPTELAVGEAFIRGDFDVTGDLEAACGLNDLVGAAPRTPAMTWAILKLLRQLPETNDAPAGIRHAARLHGRQHSHQRDRAAIQYHYDVSNEFYMLWLDKRLTYSCAYFETGDEDLDRAQEAKYDLICRKLRLKPGERLLDIGCGWGGLMMFAAERYGVEATGVTLSARQAALAKERASAAGLSSRVRILLEDYRDLPVGMPFDKIVSVGMFEHVGRPRLPQYFTTAHTLLKTGGLFLNHGIAAQHDFQNPARRMLGRELSAHTSFIWNYVFPDGELVPISESLGIAERAGWEVRDVESLREHYAMTLRHWNRRLAAHEEEAKRLVGEEAYRVWRLYMAGSAYSFAHERVSIYQALFTKPDASGNAHIPLTRRDIYQTKKGN